MNSCSNSMNYDKIGRHKSSCCGGTRGVRLNITRRFSVSRLRRNFLFLFGVLRRWRNSYRKSLRQLKGRLVRRRAAVNGGRKNVSGDDGRVGIGYNGGSYYSGRVMGTMAHSKSFSSEAIADCLEFIKRNSVSRDDERNPILLNG